MLKRDNRDSVFKISHVSTQLSLGVKLSLSAGEDVLRHCSKPHIESQSLIISGDGSIMYFGTAHFRVLTSLG